MPTVSLTVENDEMWLDALGGVREDTLKVIKDSSKRAAYLTGAHFQVYPNKPSASIYLRTGDLRDSVKLIEKNNGYELSIDPVSPRGVHYGTYVIGDADGHNQAWMHKSRWDLLKDEAEKQAEKMYDRAEAQMQANIRERGIG